MLVLYVDAGTVNNGKRGFQKTTIAVADVSGKILFERHVGDYTNNQGEILAILAALMRVEPGVAKHIYSDSKIAINWAQKGKQSKKALKIEQRSRRVLPENTKKFMKLAYSLLCETGSVIEWIPREVNRAGWYLEEKYHI